MIRHTVSLLVASWLVLTAATAFTNTLVVGEVRAGDLLVLGDSWQTHLLGITVPDPQDPVGYHAFDFTKRRLEGKIVKVFTFTTDNTASGIVRGEDGLPFAKILFGEAYSEDIAALLLAEGYARVDDQHLPKDCEHYREIEMEARTAGRGVWARE